MQTEPGNNRYRGWRESKKLVEVTHSAPCDFTLLTGDLNDAENSYNTASPNLGTLLVSKVSQLQHLRKQLRHRLRTQVDE